MTKEKSTIVLIDDERNILTSLRMALEAEGFKVRTYNEGVAKGDPRLSSAETGRILTEKLVDITARFAAHFAARTPAKTA